MKATPLTGGLDAKAYNEAAKGRAIYGPVVCVCLEPQADPSIDFGMCQVCKRPVVAFMRIMRAAS